MTLEIVTVEDLQKTDIGFHNVVGLQNLKAKVAFIIKALNQPSKNVSVPKGMIFAGLPGCGKTFFGKILAKQLGFNYLYISAASLQSPVPGIGKSKVMNLFKEARNRAPCVLFLDEIDAVVKDRDTVEGADSGGILQQFLTELDGQNSNAGIIVIAATNVLGQLDKAFTRSGRFDMKFMFDNPGTKERAMAFRSYLGPNSSVDLGLVAEITEGMSYADLNSIYKQACEYAFMSNDCPITNIIMVKAVQAIMAGESSNSELLTKPAKKLYISHMAAHTFAYAMLGPNFMSFGQTNAGVKLICCPHHRKAKIHRCADYIVQLASILSVKNHEAKISSATNLYAQNDHPKINELLDNIIGLLIVKNTIDPKLVIRLKTVVANVMSNFLIKLFEKHKDIFANIEEKYSSTSFMTRKDLIEINSTFDLSPSHCNGYRLEIEEVLKKVLIEEINAYEKENGIDVSNIIFVLDSSNAEDEMSASYDLILEKETPDSN